MNNILKVKTNQVVLFLNFNPFLNCFQHVSNGPVNSAFNHDEQMEEMEFILDKRTKECERVRVASIYENLVLVEIHSRVINVIEMIAGEIGR